MLYIYSHYVMKLHEFFFFLQAHAGIFFSSSISCMNFFFGSDTPPPRISNGSPLTYVQFTVTIARIRTYFLDIWQFGNNARIC